MADITIKNVVPKAALPGGEVVIEYSGRELAGTSQPEVRFGDFSAQVTMASSAQIVAKVPEPSAELGTSELVVATNGDTSVPFPYEIGKKVAANLHPVANPAIDAEGNIYATYSGRRGQKTPVSIYKISPKGAVTPFVTDIMNATGLAFSLTGELFVSSRFEGNVYHVDRSGRTELFIEGMGIATGIAFDHDGNLYVGDRSGSIFKISASKEIFVFATFEPSIAAYHLAFGFDDNLYVTGPTTSSFDSIYRVSPSGAVERFLPGWAGRKVWHSTSKAIFMLLLPIAAGAAFSVSAIRRKPELVVAGLSLVGLAFDLQKNLMVVDSGSLYRVRLGIMGKPLP